MNRMTRPSRTFATAATGLVAVMALAAGCGGGDDDSASTPNAGTVAAGSVAGTEPPGEQTPGGGTGEILDELTDAMGESGDVVSDAIDALPTESLWGIVADQLGDDVGVEIDGVDIQLVFQDGSVDDALFDCTVANSFVEEGQTVTMVYPDGNVTCGQ